MNEEERELLCKTMAATELLKVEVAALQELVIALAIALTEKPNPSLDDATRTMGVIRKLTRFTKGEDTAEGMKYVIDNLRALSNVHPIQALLMQALLYQQTGDSKQDALQSWLGQATPDEIGQDIWQALASFRKRTDPQTGDDESRGD